MNNYTHIGESLSNIANPRISNLFDILREQPDYAEEDTQFVQRFEAAGGPFAPPGALTLHEHDVVHLLTGVNFVPYDTENQRKDGERFLTGFQFGADPKFTKTHLAFYIDNVNKHAPDEYQFGDRGYKMLLRGVVLGRRWRQASNMNLRDFVQDALENNRLLNQVIGEFFLECDLEGQFIPPNNPRRAEMKKIQTQIVQHLNQIRGGVGESFRHRYYFWSGIYESCDAPYSRPELLCTPGVHRRVRQPKAIAA